MRGLKVPNYIYIYDWCRLWLNGTLILAIPWGAQRIITGFNAGYNSAHEITVSVKHYSFLSCNVMHIV
jgi:hypothetical protein